MPRLSPTAKFALKFILGCVAFMSAFEATRGTLFERFLVEDCLLRPAVAVIHLLEPRGDVHLVGRVLQSPSSQLHVTRGCEGVEIFLILTAAIMAFPSSWKNRALGLALGFLVAYVLSIGRLAALHFTLRYTPGAWEALHGMVLTLAPITIAGLYFMYWSAKVAPTSAQAPGKHAR